VFISNSLLLNRGLSNLFGTRCILLLCCDWSSFDIVLRNSFSSHCSNCLFSFRVEDLVVVAGFLVRVDFTVLSEGLSVLMG
jgi:hypothetical protein